MWRFPVKSMQGERLERAALGPVGIDGDRAWALEDVDTGHHLTARRVPELLFAAARLDADGGGVCITLPDGTETSRDQDLSAWLGRSIRLVEARGETGRFQTQADETETGDWLSWDGPEGSFHDLGGARVSLISDHAYGQWDRRRFRLNLVLDQPGDVDLVGQKVEIGGAVIAVGIRIGRCVMTTRPQPADEVGPAIERDLDVLRTIKRELDGFLGVGGTVIQPGPMAIGDEVKVIG
jgi:uncharacterized protein YcbX